MEVEHVLRIALGNSDPLVRRTAIKGIGRFPNVTNLQLLLEAGHDSNSAVATEAGKAHLMMKVSLAN